MFFVFLLGPGPWGLGPWSKAPGAHGAHVRPVLPWWVGGRGPFSKSTILNYFRHNKSEPDLTDDHVFTMFLNLLPNWFRLEMEPHELKKKPGGRAAGLALGV